MPFVRNYYTPVDVAIRWGHFTVYEKEILHTAFEHPEKLLYYSEHWPTLHIYLERLCDAIDCHELPAWYLGHPVTFPARNGPCSLQLRHSDLRFWALRFSPEDKPDFLFNASNDHSQCISLGTYLAQQAAFDTLKREFDQLRAEHSTLLAELKAQGIERDMLSTQMETFRMPSESTLYVLQVIIGSMLELIVGKSPSGQSRSVYKTQTAFVDAIVEHYSHLPGISKRTLDRKFAAARQRLAQAG
ncbi:hypothetical protein LZ023_16410 [Pseudomonas silvicola]|nr:hypothetical protein LZ023_16410 [Pseudomonas silvicola]